MTRKADPYEARAREMCLANGVDPDVRVVKPGSKKTMPAWCEYRQAARDEAVLAEARAVEPPPQDPKYANAPLTVIGLHDEGTIEQMRNCMKVGNVVAGVLCADGHLGYAQPVGGVIAYEDQISISGVGFDIGCFTGDTRIFTLDGNTPRLDELEGKEVPVLSCTAKGTPIPAIGRCIKTRTKAELIKVTLDNGEAVRCTPDHRFMLRDGSYERADRLAAGQSLMPLYMTADRDGYVLVRNSATKQLMRLHYMVYRAGLLGPAPDLTGTRLVIHHKNFDRADNNPVNLVPMRCDEHDAMHAAMRDKAHFNTPEFNANRIAKIKEFWQHARSDENFMNRRRQVATTNGRKMTRESAIRSGNGLRGATHLRAFNLNPATVAANKARAGTPSPCPICGEVMMATSSLYYHAQQKHPAELEQGVRPGRGKNGLNSVTDRLVLGANNHKVVSVEAITEREDVFCLTVPGLNNFGLASGVFVHNCGNMAIQLDITYPDIAYRVPDIAQRIAREISFGVGRTNDERVEHDLFDDKEAWDKADMNSFKSKAKAQLGTVGSGNHYVDLMYDEVGHVWIGVHFGSRGLGHTAATKYLKAAGGTDGMHVPPAVVDVDSELGDRYIAAMELAGRYAYAGREWVCEKVRSIVGGEVLDTVHNHHNFAWQEEHFGKQLWVVRKGATPAEPGQRGFVGGSMGDNCVILEGQSGSASAQSLFSTIHGAGRLYGRKEAKRRFDREEMDTWLLTRGVTLLGGDLDESPMAYRRLPEVLAHHKDTISIQHSLRPFVVVMAGSKESDPYRD